MIRLSSILLIALISLCGCRRHDAEVHLLRVSLWANEEHTWYKAFTYFDEILNERSNGRLRVEVYPSEQLAKELESIRLIQAGVIDMTVTASLLSNWIEIATFCEMPFLLRDEAEKQAFLKGPIGQRVEREMREKTGLIPIGVFSRGPRQLTANRPIRHPEELRGLILRVPSVPSFVTAWNAMGAKVTPMAFSEVFTGLQQGTIDAQENPLANILTGGFAEVQDYVMMTDHVMSWSYPVIGKRQLQRLPGELREIFLTAARDMEAYEKELYLGGEAQIRQRLLDAGMEFVEVDKAAFAEACEAALYQRLSPEMQKVYRDFVDARDPN